MLNHLLFLCFLFGWIRDSASFLPNFGLKSKYVKQSSTSDFFLQADLSPAEAVAGFGAALFTSLPLSIIIDSKLQEGTTRISKIANTKIEDSTGEMFCYIARPAGEENTKYPVVYLVHQFFGLRPRDTELCDELARCGFIAVAPDCYQGNTTGLIPRAINLVKGAAFNDDWKLPLRDFHRVVEYMRTQPDADTTRSAVSGFCFGGGVALRYAETYPSSDIKAVGVFYGKPTPTLDQLDPNTSVYGVFGGKDRQFPPAVVDDFDNLLQSKGIETEIRRYPDKDHAFIKDLECIRTEKDSGDAWTGWLNILERRLR